MYPSSRMMMINQTKALTPAHAHPSASSRPNRARLRGTTIPGPSARCAIVLHPHPVTGRAGPGRSLGGQRSCHVRVDRADERVRPRGKRRHGVVAFLGPGEGGGGKPAPPRRIADLDVVRDAGVLVVE